VSRATVEAVSTQLTIPGALVPASLADAEELDEAKRAIKTELRISRLINASGGLARFRRALETVLGCPLQGGDEAALSASVSQLTAERDRYRSLVDARADEQRRIDRVVSLGEEYRTAFHALDTARAAELLTQWDAAMRRGTIAALIASMVAAALDEASSPEARDIYRAEVCAIESGRSMYSAAVGEGWRAPPYIVTPEPGETFGQWAQRSYAAAPDRIAPPVGWQWDPDSEAWVAPAKRERTKEWTLTCRHCDCSMDGAEIGIRPCHARDGDPCMPHAHPSHTYHHGASRTAYCVICEVDEDESGAWEACSGKAPDLPVEDDETPADEPTAGAPALVEHGELRPAGGKRARTKRRGADAAFKWAR